MLLGKKHVLCMKIQEKWNQATRARDDGNERLYLLYLGSANEALEILEKFFAADTIPLETYEASKEIREAWTDARNHEEKAELC